MRWIFVGSNGIRAGWRLCIFAGLLAAQAFALRSIFAALLPHSPPIEPGTIPPWYGIRQDLPLLLIMLSSAWAMSRIERRPMAAYGLPGRSAFGGRFWTGALAGFVSLSAVLAIVLASRAGKISLAGAAPGPIAAGLEYAAGFLAVALAEEFLFRGYALATLSQGIGFWPAAALLAALFAAAHLSDSGESVLGIVQVVIFALAFSYVLLRTGSLWFAVGYHVAWDWGETFFYGVPDSGLRGTASLMHVTLGGPVWLTGGSAGPEGSVLTTAALIALAIVLHFAYAKKPAAAS